MNTTTRDSLVAYRDYWAKTESEFSSEQLEAINGLLADPPKFSDEEWETFLARLSGPEGCDFTESPKLTWRCGGGNDKTFSEQILAEMIDDELERKRVLTLIDVLGGHCDCEVIFNTASLILSTEGNRA